MQRKFCAVSIILFCFLLLLSESILAHDDKHHTKSEHGSSKFYEEGSGMKMHSEKHDEYEEHGERKGQVEFNKHGKSSEYIEEGSGMR